MIKAHIRRVAKNLEYMGLAEVYNIRLPQN
jgi:hypothetical protein